MATKPPPQWAPLWWLLLAAWAAAPAHGATDAGDMAVLLELRQSISNPERLGWPKGDDACGSNWPHVQCSGSYVSGLQLANLGLEGQLPPTLHRLSALSALGLQQNALSGPLPTLSGLRLLRSVYLDRNRFDAIPADFFANLPSLATLSLDHNPLSAWSLPPALASSRQLATLSLANVSLSGSIPSFLATLPSLRSLLLSYNKLSGSLPDSFRRSNIRFLQANNQLGPVLSGSLDVLASMQSLSQIWLHGNAFTGIIPPGLADLASLKDIRLNDNQLVGPIPWGLKDLELDDFTVENNLLDGPVPPMKVAKGGDFKVANNKLCNEKPGELCSVEATALLAFLGGVCYPASLAQSWGGDDPCGDKWIGVACDGGSVSVLNLANAQLTGSISASLANLTSLTTIKLNDNHLAGIIPSSLTSLKSLKLLDLRRNRLSAPVPSFAKHVQVLTAGNPLATPNLSPPTSPKKNPPSTPTSPPAPPSTSTPVGTPLQPGSTPSAIPASPPESTSTSGSTAPDSPPSTIASPSANPAGPVGNITPSGANGTDSALHHNSSTLSMAAIMFSVIGGVVLLLFAPLGVFLICKRERKRFLRVQSPNAVIIHPRDSSDPDMVKLMVAGQNESANNNETQSGTSSGRNQVQVIEAGNLVISVQVLRNVTENFSETNILGRGGFGIVYKGRLEDGTKIAVKRMEAAVVSSKGLREFQAEIAVLTKVRHRHLVALLGYCIDDNERLLVYEYMPQGALSKHLFDWAKQSTLKPLDWKQRLIIALDVARGMEYLHGLAHRSFIHRDLKPSNILLDEDFRAKVSDFGLVKLAPDGNSVETRLAGTFGYLAPEYAVTGRVTTKSDVFSFGVVLMELITGRRALDESQPEESMHLVSWFRRADVGKQSFNEAIDPVLEITEESFHSIRIVADLAGHCTARESHKRPDMGHAVSILAPLVEQWKPSDPDGERCGGIDLEMSLPQALKLWQAYEEDDSSTASFGNRRDDTIGSLPTRPIGFAESFTSSDGR